MSFHPRVRHPRTLVVDETGRFNAAVSKLAANTLGSMALFWATFLVPLLTLPLSDTVKLIVSIIFSSWFQAWALPVLQRASNDAEAARAAKADADHEALTHIALQLDAVAAALSPRPRTPPSPQRRTTDG